MGAIDADAHVIECEATFSHIDREFRKYTPFITVQKQSEVEVLDNQGRPQKEFWVIDGRLQPMEANVGSNASKESREMASVAARLAHMDELSIDVQVLYPTVFLRPWTRDPTCEYALCKAYNRWLAGIWKQAPDRLRWTVMVPLMSMDKVEEEMRFGRENGAVGVFLRGIEHDMLFDNPYFFKLYALGQDLDLPMCFHAGNGSFYGYDLYGHSSGIGRGKLPIVATFCALIQADIPKKFPRLRWGFIEASSQWVPFALNDLELRFNRRGQRMPKTILQDNNFYVAALVTDDLDYVMPQAGVGQIVVGTDYGHADNSAEIEAIRKLRTDGKISMEIADRILYDNPKALYGL